MLQSCLLGFLDAKVPGQGAVVCLVQYLTDASSIFLRHYFVVRVDVGVVVAIFINIFF